MPSKKPRNREQVTDLLFFLRFFTAYAKIDLGDIMLGDRIPLQYSLCRERDAAKVASLAVKLWRDADHEELKREFETLVKTEDNIIFTAYFQNEMIAFAHCAIRHEYVEGAHSDDVGYLEAVYVEEQFRNLGIASHLMEYCENWAGSKGCKQFASDCEINNSASVALHRKYGFAESARLVHFIKDI